MSNKHWLASYGERIPAEINADAYRSVLEMFEQAMQRFADKPAIRCFDQTLTYADTDRLSRNFTAYLQSKLGVAKGDRIAVMLPNIPAFALAMLGIVRAGAVQVSVRVEPVSVYARLVGASGVEIPAATEMLQPTAHVTDSPPCESRGTNVGRFAALRSPDDDTPKPLSQSTNGAITPLPSDESARPSV